MKRICIIDPVATKYILPLVQGLSEHCYLDYIYSPAPTEAGFGEHQLPQNEHIRWLSVNTLSPFGKNFGLFQRGLVSYMVHNRPDAVIIFANPRYLSYWFVLIAGKILHIPIYSRGHGVYKKVKLNVAYKVMYSLMIGLSEKYICYTESVKDSLLPLTKNPAKLVVEYNTLYNDYPVYPQEKTGQEKGILFIGRLRQRCGIEELIAALRNLRAGGEFDLDLHIIGDGVLGDWVRKTSKDEAWIHYHGMVYEDRKIQEISCACRFGVFPGDAGLSVVHMMSLSLPPLTHDTMHTHMGPEPSYIQSGINGWFYDRTSKTKTLSSVISDLAWIPPAKMKNFQNNAFETYQKLSTPPHHERIWAILN
jgi:glycosyltransferase involved in cell wall biosynthesis